MFIPRIPITVEARFPTPPQSRKVSAKRFQRRCHTPQEFPSLPHTVSRVSAWMSVSTINLHRLLHPPLPSTRKIRARRDIPFHHTKLPFSSASGFGFRPLAQMDLSFSKKSTSMPTMIFISSESLLSR